LGDFQVPGIDFFFVLRPHQFDIQAVDKQLRICLPTDRFAHHFVDQAVVHDGRVPGSTAN